MTEPTIRFPFKWYHRITAIEEARQASIDDNRTVYLYAVKEGGYLADIIQHEFSNEKLIFTFNNGERK